MGHLHKFGSGAAIGAFVLLLAACGGDAPADTGAPDTAYQDAYERAVKAGYEGDEAKSLAQAVVDGEDVAWAFEPQTDTGDDGPPVEPPLTDADGLAYNTIMNYRYRMDERGMAQDLTMEFMADANSARIMKMTADDSSYYVADFSGLLTTDCLRPMPPFNIIDALQRFDIGTVGQTLTVQVQPSDPVYDFKVEGTGQVEMDGVMRDISMVSRTSEETDESGEIHTYVDQLTLLTDTKVIARDVAGTGTEMWLVSTYAPETAFEQEMQDAVEDSELGTCAGLL